MAPIVARSRSRTAHLNQPSGGSGSRTLVPETFSVGAPPPPLPTDPYRTGIVFVHGIGDQQASGTLLEWSGPMADLLTDWRRDHDMPGDPVVRSDYDLVGARLPYVELEVNEYAGHPAQTWVLTEAWWAQSTRPPTLPAMIKYTLRALGPILRGVNGGYRVLARRWSRRTEIARGYAYREHGYQHGRLVKESLSGRRHDWIYWLDMWQMHLTYVAVPAIYLVSYLALLLYDPFRRIPIKALQDSATLKSIDYKLTKWFGGLPNVSEDKIQAANVRTRLVNAVRGLRAQGCSRIVVVAHSGGAVVSFETLCDPVYADEPVDKLITLGEGLGLAWRIEETRRGLPGDSRLRGDLRALRPKLRWVDFWSTYDPAPAGPISPSRGVKLVRHQSRVTVNRMSLLEDHGAYWDNDEDFLIPLLQNIDTPAGQASDSRFFRDSSLMTVRSAWRRSRVAVLALWRWIAAVAAAIPLVVTTVTGATRLSGHPGPGRLGAEAAGWWNTVPGHGIIADPLDGPAGMARWPEALRSFGEWGLGTAIIVVAFLVLAHIGVGRWEAWDRRDRMRARQHDPERASLLSPTLTFAALTIVAAAMSFATFAYLWR
ncbi:MAG: hypothetical protein ABSC46_12720 [Candidatus Limnocylindrales bacterium]|jgi:hypothetical protein